MKQQWTYEGDKIDRAELFDHLALRGQKGWELVAVLPANEVTPWMLQLVFKRPLSKQAQGE